LLKVVLYCAERRSIADVWKQRIQETFRRQEEW
jgi:hypothetical protein